jgi:hypothetical protein
MLVTVVQRTDTVGAENLCRARMLHDRIAANIATLFFAADEVMDEYQSETASVRRRSVKRLL